MMQEFARQRTNDDVSQAVDAAESEQVREEQASEPPEADGESVWKQMREEILQRSLEEASRQAEGEADTGQGKGEKVL